MVDYRALCCANVMDIVVMTKICVVPYCAHVVVIENLGLLLVFVNSPEVQQIQKTQFLFFKYQVHVFL